ncbi:hypothetical protein [Nocardia arthritidis]|uniref:hypothetical protein n=1 Tax=Nocardia arthritidis TaxID=228602 RepID=UPI000B00B7E4|nr:hypothetical protein [Nocardia arthritidis]
MTNPENRGVIGLRPDGPDRQHGRAPDLLWSDVETFFDPGRMIDLRVRLAPDVLAIFRPVSATEIDFDIDLRELRGQPGVDILCGLLRAIGRRVGKPVSMTAEGDYGNPVLGFDPAADRVVLLADPRFR